MSSRFVGLFLDEASRARLAAKYPGSAAARSASYVLLEPADRVADPKKPAVFAPLMQEVASARVVGETVLPSGAVCLTMACELHDRPMEGLEGHVLCASFGSASGGGDDDAAADANATALRGAPAEATKAVDWEGEPLTGVICKSEFMVGGTCHLPPMLKCPLCQFMEDSPCADVFKVWEDCLNACEGETDLDEDQRQEKFMTQCAEPTLALKACVEKYPDHFGSMFGGGPPGEEDAPPPADAPPATGALPPKADPQS